MKATSIYAKVARTTAFATLAASALVGVTASQARHHFIQDVQYVQGGAQLVITPPQIVIQAPPPIYVAPAVVYPRQTVVVPVNTPVYGPRYVRDRIYYINGRAYMNGHRYVRGHAYGHYKAKKNKHHHGRDEHFDRRDGRHDEGRHVGSRH